MQTNPRRLVSATPYHAELLHAIKSSRKRVTITAMVVGWDDKTKPIFHELEKALSRGVEVTMVFDIYITSPFAPGIFTYFTGYRKSLKQLFQACDALSQNGASISFIKSLGINPFKNRYHFKAAIVDDSWFSYGGVNFCKVAFEINDYMLTGESKSEADILQRAVKQFQTGEMREDTRIILDPKNTLLIDAGTPHRSIIYSTATMLALKATKVTYVSQMPPAGQLAKALGKTNTTYFYNPPMQFTFPANIAAIIDTTRNSTANNYRKPTFLHAKFIIYEFKDEPAAVISGSHNFSQRGVEYGTQEGALLSTDTALIKQFQIYLTEYIK
jgi:phosphatidylserine/phosphatidylglycerophosphate/cardiolipin synthase-like enzyme